MILEIKLFFEFEFDLLRHFNKESSLKIKKNYHFLVTI